MHSHLLPCATQPLSSSVASLDYTHHIQPLRLACAATQPAVPPFHPRFHPPSHPPVHPPSHPPFHPAFHPHFHLTPTLSPYHLPPHSPLPTPPTPQGLQYTLRVTSTRYRYLAHARVRQLLAGAADGFELLRA